MTETDPSSTALAEGFVRFRQAVWGILPAPIRRAVPATFIGYCFLNLCTFSLDLGLLTLLYDVLHLPNPVAVTLSYGTALSLAYLLNRWFNFRSHGSVGRQGPRYVAAVVINYVVFILGVGSGLTYLGVQFQLARILAGVGEALWMYCAMRWFVFRDVREPRG